MNAFVWLFTGTCACAVDACIHHRAQQTVTRVVHIVLVPYACGWLQSAALGDDVYTVYVVDCDCADDAANTDFGSTAQCVRRRLDDCCVISICIFTAVCRHAAAGRVPVP
jgi:hypothetical protein